MRDLWARLMARRHALAHLPSRKRQIGFLPLEDRNLMAIIPVSSSVPAITAKATPQILHNSHTLIPVTIHGTFHQDVLATLAGNPTTVSPSAMFYIQKTLLKRAIISPVNIEGTDQYRQYQPRVQAHVQLVKSKFNFYPVTKFYASDVQLVRDYTYSAVIYLQASENSGTHGRRYTVAVSVSDPDNGAGTNFSVVVPDNAKP